MRPYSTLLAMLPAVSGLMIPRHDLAAQKRASTVIAPARYDGLCYYPAPDLNFDLQSYLGTWYQVAGTPFFATLGSKCITADYQLNDDGTVKVVNTARLGPVPTSIVGSATTVDPAFGPGGAFLVSFPGTPAGICQGPNYIVQEYGNDYAIVQTERWDTLYILSRTRQPAAVDLDAWINRAVALGTHAALIQKNDQTGCE